MNDMCWLWLFICVSIYIHKLCWPWLFFGHNTSHFLTFPIDSATSRLETRKTTLAWLPQSPMPATWNALSHVTTHHLFSLPHRQRDVAIREKNKTTSKQSTTCRPPTKKTRTLRYAFGKKCISGPKSMWIYQMTRKYLCLVDVHCFSSNSWFQPKGPSLMPFCPVHLAMAAYSSCATAGNKNLVEFTLRP